MHLLYSFCYTLAFLLALPYFLVQALLSKKYHSNFKQRLGFLPAKLHSCSQGRIWIHAVSVGEVLAILPLARALRQKWASRPLFVSTTTTTGQNLANQKLSGIATIFYFPFDWRLSVSQSLDRIRPDIVLIAETEIWPNFLRECRLRHVPVILINGRISDRSIQWYRRIRWFMQRALSYFDYCCMQSQRDLERILSLGVPAEKTEVCGNLKYEVGAPDGIGRKIENYRRLLGLKDSSFLIVAGSTMKDEEAKILSAFRTLKKHCPQAVLLLAPRHPERFKEVEQILTEESFRFIKRSALKADGQPNSSQGAPQNDPSPSLPEGFLSLQPSAWELGEFQVRGMGTLEGSQGEGGVVEKNPSQIHQLSIFKTSSEAVDVILLDSMGELATLYALADVVFIGGSLVPRGGHNILEPALFRKPILFGPHMSNFRETAEHFIRQKAAFLVDNESVLSAKLVELYQDAALRQQIGENGYQILRANRGATECILNRMDALLSEPCGSAGGEQKANREKLGGGIKCEEPREGGCRSSQN